MTTNRTSYGHCEYDNRYWNLHNHNLNLNNQETLDICDITFFKKKKLFQVKYVVENLKKKASNYTIFETGFLCTFSNLITKLFSYNNAVVA